MEKRNIYKNKMEDKKITLKTKIELLTTHTINQSELTQGLRDWLDQENLDKQT